MITVSRGDWRKPNYTQESKEAFYAMMRKPLGVVGTDRVDPTTHNLAADLAATATKSPKDIMQVVRRTERTMVTGIARVAWSWGYGYILHESVGDQRVAVQIASSMALELQQSYTSFEVIRQHMLDQQAAVDIQDDGSVRADARRSMIEFFDIRTRRRISGGGNGPVVLYEGDGLATLAAGGGWCGCVFEISAMVFPGLMATYTPLSMMEKTVAMTNAIASLPRDQREGTTNALIPIYKEVSGDLDADLAAICSYLDTAGGEQLAIVGHFVAVTNNHSRYIMLAVFLASARLSPIPLMTNVFHGSWQDKAASFAKRMPVPVGCISTPQTDRELRINEAINNLWSFIQLADSKGTDDSIQSMQRAFHQFVDEEVMGICWRTADPAVLWAVCAGLFWTMLKIDGMAELLLRGDSFKSLYVESEGFEDLWLREIYKSKP